MNQVSEIEMIPIVDLKKQYESSKVEIDSAIKDVCDSSVADREQSILSFPNVLW